MSILSDFHACCKTKANNIAFIEDEKTLSYDQVQQLIQQVSAVLLSTEKPIQRVIISIERGIHAAISILAVLNIGATYIPLDLKNPVKRLNYIIKDADADFVIGKGDCPAWLTMPDKWLDIDTQYSTSYRSSPSITDESIAAILYTSGSTGNPKGVALSHRAMKNFYQWATDTFDINEKDRIASLAPFHFDLSVFDLFTSLSCGAAVDFMPAKLSLSPSRLTRWLSDHRITCWYTVPSILSFIALKGSLNTTQLPHLKTILFAGEVFPTPQLISLCQLLPGAEFYNLYGPTETNVCCYWPVNRTQLQPELAIPIGIPACDSSLIIDADTGELFVKSDNNLSGYWQQGQLIPALSTDNYYATGDKVSLNTDNEYCYHGRLDRMLKCSGYRVEPAEIEQVILECPEVESCVVIGIADSTSGQRPAAAVVLKQESTLADIISPIRKKLATYMQPCRYIVLDSIPYMSNGKLDYQHLQKLMEKHE